MNSRWRLPSNNFMKLSRLLDGEANIECNMQNHPNLCKTTWNHPEPSNMSILACIFHLLWKKTLQKKKGWINTFLIHYYALFAQYGIEKPSNFTDSLKKNPFWHVFLIKRIFHLLWKKMMKKKKGQIITLFSFIIMPYLHNMGLRSHQTFLQPKKYQGRRNFPWG